MITVMKCQRPKSLRLPMSSSILRMNSLHYRHQQQKKWLLLFLISEA